MPLYQYLCQHCNISVEKLQKFSDAPLTECPECNHQTLEKQVSTGTSFCFMGHGWEKPGMSVSNTKH
jgi:putative FmdB family regulatory protein